jgi:uncharacterized protein with GYD domain
MPKYMLEINYPAEGIKAVLEKGGSAREAAAREVVASVGGSLESFYFAFGGTDAYAVADLPDNAAAAAIALTVTGGGGPHISTVVLLTPAEIDAASQQQVRYDPPGS